MWPYSRCSESSLKTVWETRLCFYKPHEIRDALVKHQANEPDATRPVWKSVYVLIGQGGGAKSENPVQEMLRDVRRGIDGDPRWSKRGGSRNLTDQEVWLNRLDALTRAVVWDAVSCRMKDDPDGRLNAIWKTQRKWWTDALIARQRECMQPVPDWLLE